MLDVGPIGTVRRLLTRLVGAMSTGAPTSSLSRSIDPGRLAAPPCHWSCGTIARSSCRPRRRGPTPECARRGAHPTPQVNMDLWPGRPYPLGATYDGTGVNFAVFSEVADASTSACSTTT